MPRYVWSPNGGTEVYHKRGSGFFVDGRNSELHGRTECGRYWDKLWREGVAAPEGRRACWDCWPDAKEAESDAD